MINYFDITYDLATLFDFIHLFVVIWFIPHIPMMLFCDGGDYWKYYKGCSIGILVLCGVMAVILIIVASFASVLGNLL